MDRIGRLAALAHSTLLIVVLVAVLLTLRPWPANAKGGSNLAVTTTGSAAASIVSGVVTLTNSGTKPESITSIRESLEVRFPTGTTPPALPPGSTDGWYLVTSAPVGSAGSVPPNAMSNNPYAIDTCAGGVSGYRGAKDMRSVAVVTQGTQAITARSASYALPAKCPVCGNGIVESGEQCDGGTCCSTTCRFAATGTACNDGNACTQVDQCQNGACIGAQPVVCSESDQCHQIGACNPATGVCSTPNKANGSACNDGNACTQTDSCQSGICVGANPITCSPASQCQVASCDTRTGLCSDANRAEGTECADGNACTVADSCADGACHSGTPRDCNDHMSCTDDTCDEATGCAHTATPTCDVCDNEECIVCGNQCDAALDQCSAGCWTAFWSCLDHCTTTYCAPFCQVDLSNCITACPATAPCRSACDDGNGCGADCAPLP